VVHVKLQQSAKLFKQQVAKQQIQKHLCLIIDDSGSMAGYPIKLVREHCAKFGEKFFKENGKQITLIKFGTKAYKSTYTND
jgi:cobalamin biosynthesis protein CobT